jgi:hypothetical protein
VIAGKRAKYTPSTLSSLGPAEAYTDSNPAHYRNDTGIAEPLGQRWFQKYMIGIGGACSLFVPPVSYWCSELPRGGRQEKGYVYNVPSGIAPEPGALPNSPYKVRRSQAQPAIGPDPYNY